MGRIRTIGHNLILFTDGNFSDLKKFDLISKLVKIFCLDCRSFVVCPEKLPYKFWEFENIDSWEVA